MSSIVLGACSNDDQDVTSPTVKMHLTSFSGGYIDITWGDNLTFSIENIKYDSDGRVISYKEDDKETSILYADDKIILSNGNWSTEYTVSDGKIIASNSDKYQYDSEGHLISISQSFGNETLTWENGNITRIKSDDEIFSYQYNNEYNPIANLYNVFFSTVFVDVNPLLAISGYYGVMPKQLLKSQTVDDEFDREYEYKYNSNGYPIFIKVIDDEGDIQEYTLEWSTY